MDVKYSSRILEIDEACERPLSGMGKQIKPKARKETKFQSFMSYS